MATDFLHAPHPLLKAPVLYVADVPGRVKWNHLERVFQTCGQVRSGGRSAVVNSGKKWTVMFANVFNAEMALATLQGKQVPGVNPPFVLKLSHSPTLQSASPPNPLYPQFINSETEGHPLHKADVQDIFLWFRNAGPLASVRVNVDVGRSCPTCVVEYWDEVHANHARTNCRTLCQTLEAMPRFSLRTFDPCNLYCARLGDTFKTSDMREHFSQFGQIVEARLVRGGIPDAFGFVSYKTREETARAMKGMNGKAIGNTIIQVRYHEPKFQAIFRMPFKSRPGPNTQAPPSDAASNAGTDEPDNTDTGANDTRRRENEVRQKEEEALRQNLVREQLERERLGRERLERERQEQERREREQDAEVKRQKRLMAQHKREEAQRAERLAALETLDAEEDDIAAKQRLADSTNSHDDAKRKLQETDEAVREAERALQAAKLRRMEAAQESINSLERKVEAANSERGASARLRTAHAEEARLRAEREQAEKEEQAIFEETEEVDEEARRQQELAESIRKMKELREIEEAERRERVAKEQQAKREKEEAELRRQAAERLAQAECERKEREEKEREKERQAREKREREEQEARRRRAYEDASAKERHRCQQRDFQRWNVHNWTVWTKQRGVERFEAISIEFDDIKFCDAQPLTFESVPWPILSSPHRLTVDDIEWSAVEAFFAAAKLVVSESQYKAMVERTHRRFHPDRWRSRGLLNTVLDFDLRKRLEENGNVVAQAMTPIWLASKAKM